MASIIALAITLFFLVLSCKNAELERMKNENTVLRRELDSIKNKEAEKKKFLGTYVNTKGGFYAAFDFKGETTVMVIDGFVGWKYASSYERDGNIIRISTDKTDLILTVQDSSTLIGEGFASGIYVKKNFVKGADSKKDKNRSTRVERKKPEGETDSENIEAEDEGEIEY